MFNHDQSWFQNGRIRYLKRMSEGHSMSNFQGIWIVGVVAIEGTVAAEWLTFHICERLGTVMSVRLKDDC